MIVVEASLRPLLRDLYDRLTGPLNSPPILIVLCVAGLAVLLMLRIGKR